MPAIQTLDGLFARTSPCPMTGCWLWLGAATPQGYGNVNLGRAGFELAHRLAFRLAKGQAVRAGLYVCHTCDVRLCVNPAHLFEGTAKDNMQDASRKGRLPAGVKHNSYLRPETVAFGRQSGAFLHAEKYRGENNGRAKLTQVQVNAIRARVGEASQALAKEYGVTKNTITRILARSIWTGQRRSPNPRAR